MKRIAFLGVLSLSAAMAGAASANLVDAKTGASKVSKPGVRVVAGAKALSVADKASVDGQCGCGHTDTPPPAPEPTPPPAPEPPSDVKMKPGYGFGTTGHYGPPGQDFTPAQNWRKWVKDGNKTVTPAGHPLPGQALVRP